jgi:hypothetical protein
MPITVAGFQWDRGNRSKCRAHGVSIADIEEAFRRPLSVFPDPAHSLAEERFKAIGTSAAGRHLLIVFTLRDSGRQTFIRPISARFMHAKEIDYYEKAAAELANR